MDPTLAAEIQRIASTDAHKVKTLYEWSFEKKFELRLIEKRQAKRQACQTALVEYSSAEADYQVWLEFQRIVSTGKDQTPDERSLENKLESRLNEKRLAYQKADVEEARADAEYEAWLEELRNKILGGKISPPKENA